MPRGRPLLRKLLPRSAGVTSQAASAPPAAAAPPSGRPDFARDYRRHVQQLLAAAPDEDTAMRAAIGGEFEATGQVLRDLLVFAGLGPDGRVVDVGCGSGRLAIPLSEYLVDGDYLGLDVVPELTAYAARKVGRPSWRFEVPDTALTIPAEDASADLVCFFSVLTHLLHEESYRYLQEAARVLRPEGRIVFSFLEFHIPSHWAVFDHTVASMGTGLHLNQFIERNAIEAWCQHLGLRVVDYLDGDKANIPLSRPVTYDDGRRAEDLAALGQSVAILAHR